MKKKNLVKKTLLPALVAVLCSLVALTSVSYAWFTLGNTASVGQIDVNVTAADGIQISADAANWKSVLPVEELKTGYDGDKNLFPAGEIAPMSSAGNVADGLQEMFFGEIDENGNLVSTKQDETNSANFIAFDIFVNSTVAKDFYLLNTSTVTAKADSESNPEIAVRVSFVYLGYDADPNAALNVKTSSDVVIWEPNAKNHIDDVKRVYGEEILTYRGVNAASDTAFALDDEEKTTLMNAVKQFDDDATLIDDTTGSGIKLCSLAAGYNKIRVYIWLEGQDADCTNVISGGGFSVKLEFATNKN